MTQPAENTPAAPEHLVVEAPVCDREGCKNAATFAYFFDWGEQGICCSEHATLLQQSAANVQRGVQLTPLAKVPTPMTRDERITHHATVLTLQEELKQAQERGLELYRANQQLLADKKLLQLRDREQHAQLEEAHKANARLQAEIERRDTENARLVDENERLKPLESFVGTPEPS